MDEWICNETGGYFHRRFPVKKSTFSLHRFFQEGYIFLTEMHLARVHIRTNQIILTNASNILIKIAEKNAFILEHLHLVIMFICSQYTRRFTLLLFIIIIHLLGDKQASLFSLSNNEWMACSVSLLSDHLRSSALTHFLSCSVVTVLLSGNHVII